MRGCALRKVVRNLAHILPPSICLAVFSIKPTLFHSFPPVCVASQYFDTNQRSLVLLSVLVPSTSTQLVGLGRLPGGWVLSTRCREEGGRARALACPEISCKEPYPTGSRPPCRRETQHLRLRQPVPAMKGEPAPQKEHDVSPTSGSPDPPVMRSDSDSHSSSRSASTHVSL